MNLLLAILSWARLDGKLVAFGPSLESLQEKWDWLSQLLPTLNQVSRSSREEYG